MMEIRALTSIFPLYSRHPESVIRCILPYTVEADISMKIQHKLIEAYCWENEIEVVKVSSTEEITAALQNTTVDVGNEVDLDCLLVCDKEQLLVADSDTEFMDWDPDDDFKNGPS